MQIWRATNVLHEELPRVCAREWSHTGQQFLENDGQAVLVRKAADVALERFRSGVNRRHTAGYGCSLPFQQFRETEVTDFDVVKNEQQVLRFHVQMLNLVIIVHQIQGFSSLFHVAEELVARDAGKALASTLTITIP